VWIAPLFVRQRWPSWQGTGCYILHLTFQILSPSLQIRQTHDATELPFGGLAVFNGAGGCGRQISFPTFLEKKNAIFKKLIDSGLFSGRDAARAEDAQETPIQSHISPSLLVYEDNTRVRARRRGWGPHGASRSQKSGGRGTLDVWSTGVPRP